ncbi:hypothetical protein HK102_004910, partial [Quaeritorhiza haematococci]
MLKHPKKSFPLTKHIDFEVDSLDHSPHHLPHPHHHHQQPHQPFYSFRDLEFLNFNSLNFIRPDCFGNVSETTTTSALTAAALAAAASSSPSSSPQQGQQHLHHYYYQYNNLSERDSRARKYLKLRNKFLIPHSLKDGGGGGNDQKKKDEIVPTTNNNDNNGSPRAGHGGVPQQSTSSLSAGLAAALAQGLNVSSRTADSVSSSSFKNNTPPRSSTPSAISVDVARTGSIKSWDKMTSDAILAAESDESSASSSHQSMQESMLVSPPTNYDAGSEYSSCESSSVPSSPQSQYLQSPIAVGTSLHHPVPEHIVSIGSMGSSSVHRSISLPHDDVHRHHHLRMPSSPSPSSASASASRSHRHSHSHSHSHPHRFRQHKDLRVTVRRRSSLASTSSSPVTLSSYASLTSSPAASFLAAFAEMTNPNRPPPGCYDVGDQIGDFLL